MTENPSILETAGIMKILRFIIILLPILFSSLTIFAQKPKKYIAVTIDDLPTVTDLDGDRAEREITRKIVGQIKSAGIPAIGFVNENQLFPDGKADDSEINLLREWLDAKIDLGNHTYSHADIDAMTLGEYEKDILKGEKITKKLLRQYGKKMIYFRHPYLKTGADLQTKIGLENFLKAHGYTVAPVTVEASDWVFAHAYDKALLSKNKRLMKKISDAYIPFVLEEFDYSEKQSDKLFGRNIKQTLLLHANNINAENLGKLIQALRNRGYKFVSLAETLRDPAYRTKDNYVGADGKTWLDRWALTLGVADSLDQEPAVPQFVRDEAGPETY